MAVKYTASAASGYLTNVVMGVIGNYRTFQAHYSAPSIDTGYVDPGMCSITNVFVEDADPTTFQYGTNSVGGQTVYFSGLVVGSTGNILIIGW